MKTTLHQEHLRIFCVSLFALILLFAFEDYIYLSSALLAKCHVGSLLVNIMQTPQTLLGSPLSCDYKTRIFTAPTPSSFIC